MGNSKQVRLGCPQTFRNMPKGPICGQGQHPSSWQDNSVRISQLGGVWFDLVSRYQHGPANRSNSGCLLLTLVGRLCQGHI